MRPCYLGIVLALFVHTACGGRDTPTPTAPTPVAALSAPTDDPEIALANWRGDATVTARSGFAGCGWGTAVGEEWKGVAWRVTIDGESILLDENLANWPTDHIGYSGTLDGQDFTAHFFQGEDYARWLCQFREAHLVGRFSADFSTFEADETLVWGVPGQEMVVQRRWVAWRM